MEVGSHESDILALFRERGALSRTDVMTLSGLSRSTVNHRLNALTAASLLTPIEGGESTGGRPSSRFEFRADRAAILCADIGATGFTAAVCDLTGAALASVERSIDVWEGPEAVLSAVLEAFSELPDVAEIWAIAVGVPGPVEFAAHRVVNPPIMSGWDGFDIAEWFAPFSTAPVIVENDANARAVAEARVRRLDNVIGLKLGTGIGAGLVFNGQIIRGDKGAAGDIGHTRAVITDPEPRECRCGSFDCVEAYAGGWALQRELAAIGIRTSGVRDIVDLVARGDIETVRKVRAAGRVIGDAIADLVSILNPRAIALSGLLAECDEILMAGIRERIYQRATPLVTRDLIVARSTLGSLAGVIGLALIASDTVLEPSALESVIRRPAVRS
ncbi:ROK family protein [Microbacterium sp. zg.B48]|uniref:ROK family protein n=1 Tax=Microbacterium sp. zg.B48 TaxID=2969408 RepID=UPI00214B6950|nr:ROK family protein [Microbacterium sp. zg.B48]MCR2762495.1 ROK family protein [Microbacterium sp. zg.B48]